jgi:hypothetical protein
MVDFPKQSSWLQILTAFFFGDIVYNSIATNRILLQPNSIFNLNYQPTIISISKVKFVHNTIQ